MNKIEQMVKEMCPGGVEKVKLIHYCNVLYGFPFESQYFSEDSSLMPIIRIRDVVPGVASTYYSGAFAQEYVVKKGDVLVGMDGNFNLAKWNDRDGLLNQRVCKLYTKNDNMLIDGFVYHYMKPEFKRIELNTPGGSVKHLSAKIINSIEIPLPSLPIQEAIVEILDKFESLQQGLQDELQARKKQYEYYRNYLLNLSVKKSEQSRCGQFLNILLDKYPNSILEYKLSDICNIAGRIGFRGYTREDQVDEGKGAISLSPGNIQEGLMDYSKCTYISWEKYYESPEIIVSEGDVILCKTASIGKVAKVSNLCCKATINPQLVVLKEIKCNASYLVYLLGTNKIQQEIISLSGVGSVPNVSQKALGSISLLIPHIAIQEAIVEVLDKMQLYIVNLQKELSMRTDQYSYYSNVLLNKCLK